MYIFAYLRASTKEQDAERAKNRLKGFVMKHDQRIAGWYVENVSGASLERPELLRLLDDAEPGDIILVEQVDRLSRLDDKGWDKLKLMIKEKSLSIISLDLPTSHIALTSQGKDEFTRSMLTAVNGMLLDMLAAIARKDYEDRRRRQQEGMEKAKAQGKYRGRPADKQRHETILRLRYETGMSASDTAKICGVSVRTVQRVCEAHREDECRNGEQSQTHPCG